VKRIILFFSIFLIFFDPTSSLKNNNKRTINKVIIDAGHGGHDPGCLGSKSKEKDVVLSIALKLGNYINKGFPDVKVIYTRSTDVFVELYNRAKIANNNKADLFISIHCNSGKPTAFGAETWVMGLHKSEANLEVSKKENATVLLEDNYLNNYDGFDPNSVEGNIIFSLFQNAYLDQSINFAALVQKQFKTKVGMNDRGVKQAGFLVLYKTAMPGVLIEAGFLSNKKEEQFLISPKGQDYIASAIYRAFKEYKIAYDANNFNFIELTYLDTNTNKNQNYFNFSDTTHTAHKNDSSATINDKNPNNNIIITHDSNTKKQEVVFKVQFYTSPVKKPLNAQEFSKLNAVDVYFHGGLYKYTVGNEKTMQDAVSLQKKMHSTGYKDAFVVAFLNGERISPNEAVKILNKK